MDPPKTFSAGGIVINQQGNVLVVQEYGYFWGLPRGHIEPGESARIAAEREIAEEAGITKLEFVKELGAYERSTFDKDGRDNHKELKHITYFLFTTPQMAIAPRDTNITDVKWVRPNQVANLFIHPKDIAFYQQQLSQLPKN